MTKGRPLWTASAIAVGLLAGFSAVSAVSAAELTPAESESLRAPLARTDPRAQLDPSLEGVPNMPTPVESDGTARSKRRARRAVVHELATGKTRHERSHAARSGGDAFAAESIGAAESGQADVTLEAKPGGGSIGPRVIWGTDDRVRITPTTAYPWRAQTKLIVTFPNGAVYGCSGTLIAPKYLITAGHCVNSATDGGWATRIEAIPGYDNGYRPYGSAFATYLRSNSGWTSYRDPQYDFAVVTLDRLIGNTVGWFGYGAFSDSTLLANYTNLSGYPGDKCNAACQYYDSDPVASLAALSVYYRTDTFGGQSGSGVYTILNSSRYVIAAHRGTCSGSATANCGPRITSDRFYQIQGWLNSGY